MTQKPFFSHKPNELISLSERNEVQELFLNKNLKTWLLSIVSYLNQNDTYKLELSNLFQQWTEENQQFALKRFSMPQFVHCINAIFFYKLYPDKLFNVLIHPEKLVSVRMRLGLLHHFIEILQQQLIHFALPHGLQPELDYLFHGDDLPQGIMIEVEEQHRLLIQQAVSLLKIQFNPENEAQVTLERLQDLARAYKFWFNPNRLIDAVMVLQRRLVQNPSDEKQDLNLFEKKMIDLYGQLTTNECLNLYGYFSNKDSKYLMNILNYILGGNLPSWLHPINAQEKKAILSVFQALQCLMQALRIELKNRQVSTQDYKFNLNKAYIHAGKRNREAVYRILSIYGRETISGNDNMEKLFHLIENKEAN